MNSIFGFVVGILQATLSLLGFVQANPTLPQPQHDHAVQVAQQAVTQATKVVASSTLAASPANNTVGGQDINRNGIRDDVDQYIQQNFLDANQKAAAIQEASALQAALLQAADKDASLINAKRLSSAIDCEFSFADEAVRNKFRELQPLTLNTDIRTRGWLAFNDQIAGGYFTGTVGNRVSEACIR